MRGYRLLPVLFPVVAISLFLTGARRVRRDREPGAAHEADGADDHGAPTAE